ncbi:MAG: transketolase [Clostridia bacterium]|nr:transketolase [Clostridia bacterium]
MQPVENKAITTIRILAAEAIQKANSGHPGLPIGSAPAAYTLWKQMRHDPADPNWQGRDRFVLSAGHASMLEYALLHLFGYGLTIEDIKSFRQWGSKTPGHPEYHHVPGVETTTGPLGQGFATAVGMATAETRLAAHFNREGFPVVDNYTYVLMGDGCMMEGVTSEAASLAGSMKLGKLIALYDSNNITIEGSTSITFTENVAMRFQAFDWHVQEVADGEDTAAIATAIANAKAVSDKPSLIILHTEIGHGTPKAGTASAHGEPLGEDNIKAMKAFYHWEYEEAFTVPEEVKTHFTTLREGYAQDHAAYCKMWQDYCAKYPALADEWKEWHSNALPAAFVEDQRLWNWEKPMATRATSGTVLNVLAEYVPNLFGGSADLAPSNKTELKGKPFYAPDCRDAANIHFGVRELAMTCACNGIVIYGGLRAFCATFFVFSDYVKPALRLSAIMRLPLLFVLTHDSIGVGEDGPTHQPIEQLAALRATPNTLVFRPADGKETAACYIAALQSGLPSVLALTRQNLPQYEGSGKIAMKGGYILQDCEGKPDVILIASGSEVEHCVKAAAILADKGKKARVVSMPCMELFDAQDEAYKNAVLPLDVRARVAVEAGASISWYKYIGLDGACVCRDDFGASGPYSILFKEYGFTPENVVATAERIMA